MPYLVQGWGRWQGSRGAKGKGNFPLLFLDKHEGQGEGESEPLRKGKKSLLFCDSHYILKIGKTSI